MKKLLIQLDSDKFASSFDAITAYDASVDQVLSYGGVSLEDVRSLVYGAMFTRGGEALKNTAIFIGGSSVPVGEQNAQGCAGDLLRPGAGIGHGRP